MHNYQIIKQEIKFCVLNIFIEIKIENVGYGAIL